MILYLSSSEHTSLLDFTGLYDDSVTIKKMVGNFLLKQFIIYDMRNFSHCAEMILDRIAFSDSDMEFAQAIEEFLTMYNARITVIFEGLSESDPLFTALLSVGVVNIVTGIAIDKIQTEIKECLSEKGMTRYSPKEKIKPKSGKESYIFNCENIHVAVLSSQSRMGATTTAAGLSVWLNSVGANVCYVESNPGGCLAALSKAYEMEQTAHGFTLDGITYRSQTPETPYHFVVHDVGTNYLQNMRMIETADIILLCCGIKPYELPHTMKLQRHFQLVDAYMLCPFVADYLMESYSSILQTDRHKLIFMAYQPDFMSVKANSENYKSVVHKYIAVE